MQINLSISLPLKTLYIFLAAPENFMEMESQRKKTDKAEKQEKENPPK